MKNIRQYIETLDVSPFAKQVYFLLLTIPKGKVTTYKAIGNALGTKAYRHIGRVLGDNPYIPDIPCHRVVASDGKLQGYAHGLKQKEALLVGEGVSINDGRVAASCIVRSLG